MNYAYADNCPHCMYHQDFVMVLSHEGWQAISDTCRECGAELCLDVSVEVSVSITLVAERQNKRVVDPNQQALQL